MHRRSHSYKDQPNDPRLLERYRYTPNSSAAGGSELSRKKSLIRPERNRIGPDHPNYRYRQHANAQGLSVLPSTTGNDPITEDLGEEDGEADEEDHSPPPKPPAHGLPASTGLDGAFEAVDIGAPKPRRGRRKTDVSRSSDRRTSDRPRSQRKITRQQATKMVREQDERRRREAALPISFWTVYCRFITLWCPNFVLGWFGMPTKAQSRAWREKMGLLSIILLIAAFVGFLTFGFTQTVCGQPALRLKVNHVTSGYMIFQGEAYDLSRSHHPPAKGIPMGANVLYDLPEKRGGQDGSFLFQNVNGKCQGLITKAPGSDVPSNPDGSLAWYFPCTSFNQDGSSPVNQTIPYGQLGYGCHTTEVGRQVFYGLTRQGDVYFDWDDIRNASRNLMVYSGNVLDLDLIKWFNQTQVQYPAQFDELMQNPKVRGVDVTHAFASGPEKQIVQCLQEIIKVGSINTETVGCIASKVVLYVSLMFILSIVVAKFSLAVFFGWFWSRKFGARKTTMSSNPKKRRDQIEDWAEDIYTPAPKLKDADSSVVVDRSSRRGSAIFPTTSRFSSPYAGERLPKARVNVPTTMSNQNSSSVRAPPSSYRHGHTASASSIPFASAAASRTSLTQGDETTVGNRYSSVTNDYDEQTLTNGPTYVVNDLVVPQPPSDWQPFGYPLVHSVCLVTAYSEGADGLRTTLDSIATTDYPNSHKLILVICDGVVKGKGETLATPEIVLGMMTDHTRMPDEVQTFSYVAVASGSKRHNMAKVYSGFYDYGKRSAIPSKKQQRVPMMLIEKCGTPDEFTQAKPGNRGKRDSQVILMSFLQKVMFDERMTELEFEMFNGMWNVTGISPGYYETVLMVDADTKIFPDSLTHMCSTMVRNPDVMGLCGETKITNKRRSWVTMIQVFEYFISHHLSKSFESVFGGVTCLPGCFCMYRIKAPKGGQNYWVPILANPDVVEHYSENVVDTLHKKNLLLLGEDRYLSTLMLKTFPKRRQVFVPQAVCKTTVPERFSVLLSQRRRWINSTVHNLMELVLVRDLCGTFCFSMQFVIFIELVGTLVLPAAICFTFYLSKSPNPFLPMVRITLLIHPLPHSHNIDRLPPRAHNPPRSPRPDPRPARHPDRHHGPPLVVCPLDGHLPALAAHLEPDPARLRLLEVRRLLLGRHPEAGGPEDEEGRDRVRGRVRFEQDHDEEVEGV